MMNKVRIAIFSLLLIPCKAFAADHQAELNRCLWDSAGKGDLFGVKEAIAKGANVNPDAGRGGRLLDWALIAGQKRSNGYLT